MLNFQVKCNVFVIVKLNIINILNDFFSPIGLFYRDVVGMDLKMFSVILMEVTLNSLSCNRKYVLFVALCGC